MTKLERLLEGKRVLVTGGTGSLGRAFVERVARGELGAPERLVVMSRDEGKHHDLRLAMRGRPTVCRVECRIGDVRSYADLSAAVRDAHVVINAAALKQVPNCEYFPEQAVLTNTIGAANLVRAVRDHGERVETVIGVSTDKACKPTSVMGMTKALQERILIAANIDSPGARFVAVRYGNVLGTRGSVLPLFLDQIAKGGPVTITDPTMTRYLMTLDQAIDCVVAAYALARPGEILIPQAPAATMLDLAQALIGSRPIETTITGVRPGEKMHESLIAEEERGRVVQRGDYYAIRPSLPELMTDEDEGETPLDREYTSLDAVIPLDEVRRFLDRYGLLPEESGPISHRRPKAA